MCWSLSHCYIFGVSNLLGYYAPILQLVKLRLEVKLSGLEPDRLPRLAGWHMGLNFTPASLTPLLRETFLSLANSTTCLVFKTLVQPGEGLCL